MQGSQSTSTALSASSENSAPDFIEIMSDPSLNPLSGKAKDASLQLARDIIDLRRKADAIEVVAYRLRKKLELYPANGFRLVPAYNYGYRLDQVERAT